MGRPMAKCNPEERLDWARDMEDAFSCIEGRWKLLIVAHLTADPQLRLSELQRSIPQASQKMIIQQLRSLEKDGIVEREVFPQVPPKVEYRLTALGSGLGPVYQAMETWANRRSEVLGHPPRLTAKTSGVEP